MNKSSFRIDKWSVLFGILVMIGAASLVVGSATAKKPPPPPPIPPDAALTWNTYAVNAVRHRRRRSSRSRG